MPSIGEVHALPAPPPGGIGTLPPSQVVESENQNDAVAASSPPPPPPQSVPTHTKTIGMIHPPPDIRSIVDKTAQFVARNGPEFEKRILANEKNNVKFSFLNPNDPYHAYYQHRVSDFRTQLQTPASQAAPNSAASAPATGPAAPEAGAQLPSKDSIQIVKLETPSKLVTKILEPPEAEQYTVRLPEGVTGLDVEVVKLTAQFVARNGKTFLQGLTHREHQNHLFGFLKTTHSMFTFFTSLTDAYSKVLMPPKGLVDKLKKDNLNRATVLERCLNRLEWERSQERARQRAEDEIEQERVQMALIDWHDFVVVETIEFADDEDEELPKPMTVEEVIRRSKAVNMEEEEIADAGKEVEMEMDEEEVHLVEESMKAATLEEAPPKSPEQHLKFAAVSDEEPPMRIVKNWKRPEERLPPEKDPTKFVVSPITGELIPINEMAEHMRISLIDPKYKEQKERMMAKLRETTLAADDEISRNIVGLARTRPDIFGTTEEEVSNAVKAEIEKKKEEPKQVIWDGHTGSISRTANQAMAQTASADEQTNTTSTDAWPLPGPAAPPKLATPPVRPLPPPPGLALNIPRPPQPPPGQPSMTTNTPALAMPPAPRPPMLSSMPPTLRPPPPPPMGPMGAMVNRPPPPPPMAPSSMPSSVVPSPVPMPPHFSNLALPPRSSFPQPVHPSMPHMPPPPPQGMPPPPPPEEMLPPLPEEPEPKKQKLDELQLIPEDQFLVQHPGPVRIIVVVPVVEGEGNLKGQTLEVTIQSLSETIASLKEKVANEIALPANKQKLSGRAGFFKDNLSLAFYNVGPGETLTLGLRERGGRKR